MHARSTRAMALTVAIAATTGLFDEAAFLPRDGVDYLPSYTRQRQRFTNGFDVAKRRARNKAAKASRARNRK